MPFFIETHFPREKPRYTFVFLTVSVVVFLFEFLFPLLPYFSFIPAYASERPWTFITSIFLHADFSHLFFNMFALFMFGLYLESRIGSKNFLTIFFLAGIAGSFGYMLTSANPNIPAVGASGAIYGIMGSLAILSPSLIVWVGGMPMPMIVAAFFWGILEYLGLFVPGNIARGAHLAGLIVGIVFGIYLRLTMRKIRSRDFDTRNIYEIIE